MAEIYLLLGAFLVCWYFLFLRNLAETARRHAQLYCKNEGLQFIAIARESTRLTFNKAHGLYWQSVFNFEFSGDGESAYSGKISLKNLRKQSIDVPAYRI